MVWRVWSPGASRPHAGVGKDAKFGIDKWQEPVERRFVALPPGQEEARDVRRRRFIHEVALLLPPRREVSADSTPDFRPRLGARESRVLRSPAWNLGHKDVEGFGRLYERIGRAVGPGRFETDAAVATENLALREAYTAGARRK